MNNPSQVNSARVSRGSKAYAARVVLDLAQQTEFIDRFARRQQTPVNGKDASLSNSTDGGKEQANGENVSPRMNFRHRSSLVETRS